jgi:hypothetical protein
MANTPIKELIKQFGYIKHNLEIEVETKRAEFNYQLNKRKVKFERVLHQAHKKLKTGSLSYLFNANPLIIITTPLIYVLIVPLLLLDLFVSLYQSICFPIYKVKKIKRSDYIVIDRHKLGYLNIIEKIGCMYCGYANGLLSYVGEIASMTEQYFCPIKHARRVKNPHDRYWHFIDYGDANGYMCDLKTHRDQVKNKHN